LQDLNIFSFLSEDFILRVNFCGETTHSKDWIESKQPQEYGLWYIHEGTIEMNVHNKRYRASEGDLILLSPTIAYTANALNNECRFTFIHFTFELGDQRSILDHFQLSGIIPSSLVEQHCTLLIDAFDKYILDAPMSGLLLKGSLMIVLSRILECYESGLYEGEFTKSIPRKKRTSAFETLLPVFKFIKENLHLTIRNEQLAQIIGMSEKYFISYFKETIGITPGQYINQLKMHRARELIYKKSHSIQQISAMLGYADPYSFSKAFKNYYKVPPSQFM